LATSPRPSGLGRGGCRGIRLNGKETYAAVRHSPHYSEIKYVPFCNPIIVYFLLPFPLQVIGFARKYFGIFDGYFSIYKQKFIYLYIYICMYSGISRITGNAAGLINQIYMDVRVCVCTECTDWHPTLVRYSTFFKRLLWRFDCTEIKSHSSVHKTYKIIFECLFELMILISSGRQNDDILVGLDRLVFSCGPRAIPLIERNRHFHKLQIVLINRRRMFNNLISYIEIKTDTRNGRFGFCKKI